MFLVLFVFGVVAAFTVPGSCCQSNEYRTSDGQCCPRCQQDHGVLLQFTDYWATCNYTLDPDTGTVVRRHCTAEKGTQCVACEEGTYMNQPNGLSSCFLCTSCDPGDGLYKKQSCTVTGDTVCDVLPGYFCKIWEETICSYADKHTVCKPGQRIKEPGTRRADTVCEGCRPGFFSPHGVNCTAWTVCSDTEVSVTAGDSQTDVVCGDAPRHHFIPVFSVLCTFITCLGLGIKVWISNKHVQKRGSVT